MTLLFNRFVRSLTGALVLLLILSAAHAEVPFSFETTPGKLSKAVVPIHYAIDLQPNLQALTARGVAIIDIEVRSYPSSSNSLAAILRISLRFSSVRTRIFDESFVLKLQVAQWRVPT